MKSSFAAFAIAAMLMFGAPLARAGDLIETASTSPTFKTFVAAVQAAGFTATLKNTGPYTIFAPSDEAFKKLPAGALDRLLQDKAKLAQMLAHHIIPGKVMIADVKPGQVKTLEGDLLTLTSDNGLVTVDGANITQSDIAADNGVIHEIDAVIVK